jgi:glycosyltransferase involved in cell wall biosynthesis
MDNPGTLEPRRASSRSTAKSHAGHGSAVAPDAREGPPISAPDTDSSSGPDAGVVRPDGRRLRVLVLASTFPRWRGDTEPPFVYNLCRGLTEHADVTVLVPHAPGAALQEAWDGMDVRRFRYAWPEKWQRLAYGGILPNLKRNKWLWLQVPFFLAGELFAALKLIRQQRPDVIHAHWLVPQGLVAALINKLTGIPVLVTTHGSDVYAVRGRLQDFLKRWALKHVRYVTAVSFNLLSELCALGLPPDVKSEVISMGVDTSRFDPAHRDDGLLRRLGISRPTVLFVGRLYEQKGVRYLLEAMPKVLQSFPSAALVVIGQGPLRADLERRAADLGIAASVRFLGALAPEELPPYYATADVFVAPSIVGDSGDREAFGLVYAEAMASGCPVIGSAIGGTRELIISRQTGLLVGQKDADALAAAICEVLRDAELREQISSRALSWVRGRFEQSVVSQRYSQALEKAAA